ncbi:hypothetical protein FNF27_01256 [Cafeteria roenbergensis]|uniref:NUP210 Ig-like domain-containing protein n=1 Tax=Cafeteria roenbergensis TaxID=33653 RepID=A0A5A8EIP8_CAFRO|nr:hypothetical protein FNF27_01256 [Cafeteria roenbergensis]
MLGRALGAVCVAAFLASAFGYERESETRINEDFLLLPFRPGPPYINFTLVATRGCFTWESSRRDRVLVVPDLVAQGGSSRCRQGTSQRATVTAVSAKAERVDAIVTATQMDGSLVLRTEVAVDVIGSIEIATATNSIAVGSSERVGVVAKDRAGVNTFSTLEGLTFNWGVAPFEAGRANASAVEPASILAVDRMIKSRVRVSRTRARIEGSGTHFSDQAVLSGRLPGRVVLQASLTEPGYPSSPATSKAIKVMEQLAIHPRWGVRIPIGADQTLRLTRTPPGRDEEDVALPTPEFSFDSSNASAAALRRTVLLATGIAPGAADARVLDSRLDDEVVRDAPVEVFEPKGLDIVVSPYLGGAVEQERDWMPPASRPGRPSLQQAASFPAWLRPGWGRPWTQTASRVHHLNMLRGKVFALRASVHSSPPTLSAGAASAGADLGSVSTSGAPEEPGQNTLFDISIKPQASAPKAAASCPGLPARILPASLTALLEALTSPAAPAGADLSAIPTDPCDLPTTEEGVLRLAEATGASAAARRPHAFAPQGASVSNATHARGQTVLVAVCPCQAAPAGFRVGVSLSVIQSAVVPSARWEAPAGRPLTAEEDAVATTPLRVAAPPVRPLALPLLASDAALDAAAARAAPGAFAATAPQSGLATSGEDGADSDMESDSAACHAVDVSISGASGLVEAREAMLDDVAVAGQALAREAGWIGSVPPLPVPDAGASGGLAAEGTHQELLLRLEGSRVCAGFASGQAVAVFLDPTDPFNADALSVLVSPVRSLQLLPSPVTEVRAGSAVWVGVGATGDHSLPFFVCHRLHGSAAWAVRGGSVLSSQTKLSKPADDAEASEWRTDNRTGQAVCSWASVQSNRPGVVEVGASLTVAAPSEFDSGAAGSGLDASSAAASGGFAPRRPAGRQPTAMLEATVQVVAHLPLRAAFPPAWAARAGDSTPAFPGDASLSEGSAAAGEAGAPLPSWHAPPGARVGGRGIDIFPRGGRGGEPAAVADAVTRVALLSSLSADGSPVPRAAAAALSEAPVLLEGGPGVLPGSAGARSVTVLRIAGHASDDTHTPSLEHAPSADGLSLPEPRSAEELDARLQAASLLASTAAGAANLTAANVGGSVRLGPWTLLRASCQGVPAGGWATYAVTLEADRSREHTMAAETAVVTVTCADPSRALSTLGIARAASSREDLAAALPAGVSRPASDSAPAALQAGAAHGAGEGAGAPATAYVVAGTVLAVLRDVWAPVRAANDGDAAFPAGSDGAVRVAGLPSTAAAEDIAVTNVSPASPAFARLHALLAARSAFDFIPREAGSQAVQLPATLSAAWAIALARAVGTDRADSAGLASLLGSPDDDAADTGRHPSAARLLGALPGDSDAALLVQALPAAVQAGSPASWSAAALAAAFAEAPMPAARRVAAAAAPAPVLGAADLHAEAAALVLARGPLAARAAAGSALSLLGVAPWATGRTITLEAQSGPPAPSAALRLRVVSGLALTPPSVTAPLVTGVNVPFSCRGGSPAVNITLDGSGSGSSSAAAVSAASPTGMAAASAVGALEADASTSARAALRGLAAGTATVRCADPSLERDVFGRAASGHVALASVRFAPVTRLSIETWAFVPLGRMRPVYLHASAADGTRFAPGFHAALSPVLRVAGGAPDIAVLPVPAAALPAGDPFALVAAVEAAAADDAADAAAPGAPLAMPAGPAFAIRPLRCGTFALAAEATVCRPASTSGTAGCSLLRAADVRVTVFPALVARPSALALLPNASVELEVTGGPSPSELATSTIFRSSDPAVVDVDASGRVSAVGPGVATVLVRIVRRRSSPATLPGGAAPALLENPSVSWRAAAAAAAPLPGAARPDTSPAAPSPFHEYLVQAGAGATPGFAPSVAKAWQCPLSRPANAPAALRPWGWEMLPPSADVWREMEVLDSASVTVRVLAAPSIALSLPYSSLVEGEAVRAVVRGTDGASPAAFGSAAISLDWSVEGVAVTAAPDAQGDAAGDLASPAAAQTLDAARLRRGGGFSRLLRAVSPGTATVTVTMTSLVGGAGTPGAPARVHTAIASATVVVHPRLRLVGPRPVTPQSIELSLQDGNGAGGGSAASGSGSSSASSAAEAAAEAAAVSRAAVWPDGTAPLVVVPPCSRVRLVTSVQAQAARAARARPGSRSSASSSSSASAAADGLAAGLSFALVDTGGLESISPSTGEGVASSSPGTSTVVVTDSRTGQSLFVVVEVAEPVELGLQGQSLLPIGETVDLAITARDRSGRLLQPQSPWVDWGFDAPLSACDAQAFLAPGTPGSSTGRSSAAAAAAAAAIGDAPAADAEGASSLPGGRPRCASDSGPARDCGRACADFTALSVSSLRPSVASARVTALGTVRVTTHSHGAAMLRLWLPLSAHGSAWRAGAWATASLDPRGASPIRHAGSWTQLHPAMASAQGEFTSFQDEEAMGPSDRAAGGTAPEAAGAILPASWADTASVAASDPEATSLILAAAEAALAADGDDLTGGSAGGKAIQVVRMNLAARVAAEAATASLHSPAVEHIDRASRFLDAPRAAPLTLGSWSVVTVATILSPAGPVRLLLGGSIAFSVAGTKEDVEAATNPASPASLAAWASNDSTVLAVRGPGRVAALREGVALVTFTPPKPLSAPGSGSDGDADADDEAGTELDAAALAAEAGSAAAAVGRTVRVHVVRLRSLRLEWEDHAHPHCFRQGEVSADDDWTPEFASDVRASAKRPHAARTALVLGRVVPAACAGRVDGLCANPWRVSSSLRVDLDPLDDSGLELPVAAGSAVDHGLRVRCSFVDPAAAAMGTVAAVAVGPGTRFPTVQAVDEAAAGPAAADTDALPAFALEAARRRLSRGVSDAECLMVASPPPVPPVGSAILLARPRGAVPDSVALRVTVLEGPRTGGGEGREASAVTASVAYRPAPLVSRSAQEPRLSNGSSAVPGCPTGAVVLTAARPSYQFYAYGSLQEADAGIADAADASRLRLQATPVALVPGNGASGFRPVALRLTLSVAAPWLRGDARAGRGAGSSFVSRGARVVDPVTGLDARMPVCFLAAGDTAMPETGAWMAGSAGAEVEAQPDAASSSASAAAAAAAAAAEQAEAEALGGWGTNEVTPSQTAAAAAAAAAAAVDVSADGEASAAATGAPSTQRKTNTEPAGAAAPDAPASRSPPGWVWVAALVLGGIAVYLAMSQAGDRNAGPLSRQSVARSQRAGLASRLVHGH